MLTALEYLIEKENRKYGGTKKKKKYLESR